MPVRHRTVHDNETTLSDKVLDEPGVTVRGPLLLPEDSTYEDARVVQDAMFSGQPPSAKAAACSGALKEVVMPWANPGQGFARPRASTSPARRCAGMACSAIRKAGDAVNTGSERNAGCPQQPMAR